MPARRLCCAHRSTYISIPATRPPDTARRTPGHRAPARRDAPPGHAAASWTLRASATRTAPRTRRRPPDTARQLDASRPPDLRSPLPTWPAMATPFALQSTAHPFVLIVFNNSTPARWGAYGAQAHSTAPQN